MVFRQCAYRYGAARRMQDNIIENDLIIQREKKRTYTRRYHKGIQVHHKTICLNSLRYQGTLETDSRLVTSKFSEL